MIETKGYKDAFVRVPPGNCWVEGDHHGHSLDSNIFGPVALGLVKSKAKCIVWPPSRWQMLTRDHASAPSLKNHSTILEETDAYPPRRGVEKLL